MVAKKNINVIIWQFKILMWRNNKNKNNINNIRINKQWQTVGSSQFKKILYISCFFIIRDVSNPRQQAWVNISILININKLEKI